MLQRKPADNRSNNRPFSALLCTKFFSSFMHPLAHLRFYSINFFNLLRDARQHLERLPFPQEWEMLIANLNALLDIYQHYLETL